MPLGVTAAFLDAGIPTADLMSTDYPYRATMADTLDRLSADTLGVVGQVLETWLENAP
jgi:hypothetical protein